MSHRHRPHESMSRRERQKRRERMSEKVDRLAERITQEMSKHMLRKAMASEEQAEARGKTKRAPKEQDDIEAGQGREEESTYDDTLSVASQPESEPVPSEFVLNTSANRYHTWHSGKMRKERCRFWMQKLRFEYESLGKAKEAMGKATGNDKASIQSTGNTSSLPENGQADIPDYYKPRYEMPTLVESPTTPNTATTTAPHQQRPRTAGENIPAGNNINNTGTPSYPSIPARLKVRVAAPAQKTFKMKRRGGERPEPQAETVTDGSRKSMASLWIPRDAQPPMTPFHPLLSRFQHSSTSTLDVVEGTTVQPRPKGKTSLPPAATPILAAGQHRNSSLLPSTEQGSSSAMFDLNRRIRDTRLGDIARMSRANEQEIRCLIRDIGRDEERLSQLGRLERLQDSRKHGGGGVYASETITTHISTRPPVDPTQTPPVVDQRPAHLDPKAAHKREPTREKHSNTAPQHRSSTLPRGYKYTSPSTDTGRKQPDYLRPTQASLAKQRFKTMDDANLRHQIPRFRSRSYNSISRNTGVSATQRGVSIPPAARARTGAQGGKETVQGHVSDRRLGRRE